MGVCCVLLHRRRNEASDVKDKGDFCSLTSTEQEDVLEPSSEVYFYKVQHIPLFQQIYNVGKFCMEKMIKSEDCTNMLSGDTFIRIEVVGKFTKDNLNFISEGKGKREIPMGGKVWKVTLLLCFQNGCSLKSAFESFQGKSASFKILFKSNSTSNERCEADDSIIIVDLCKEKIEETVAFCLGSPLFHIVKRCIFGESDFCVCIKVWRNSSSSFKNFVKEVIDEKKVEIQTMDIIEKLFKNYLEKENEVQLTLKRLGLNQDGHTPLDLQSLSKGTQWKYLTRDDDRIRNRFFIEISSQEHEYSQLYDILRNHLNENVAANVQIDDIFSVDRIYSAIEDHKEAAKNTLIAVQFKEYIKLSNLPNSD